MSDIPVTSTNITLPTPFDESGDLIVYAIKQCQNNSERSSPYFFECMINEKIYPCFIEKYYADSYKITKDKDSDELLIRPSFDGYVIKSDARIFSKQEVFYSLTEAQATAEMLCKKYPVKKKNYPGNSDFIGNWLNYIINYANAKEKYTGENYPVKFNSLPEYFCKAIDKGSKDWIYGLYVPKGYGNQKRDGIVPVEWSLEDSTYLTIKDIYPETLCYWTGKYDNKLIPIFENDKFDCKFKKPMTMTEWLKSDMFKILGQLPVCCVSYDLEVTGNDKESLVQREKN